MITKELNDHQRDALYRVYEYLLSLVVEEDDPAPMHDNKKTSPDQSLAAISEEAGGEIANSPFTDQYTKKRTETQPFQCVATPSIEIPMDKDEPAGNPVGKEGYQNGD